MLDNATIWEISVDADAAGMRLDRFLAAHVPDGQVLSRARLQVLIDKGAVARIAPDGSSQPETLARVAVRPGDVFRVTVPAALPPEPLGESIELDVVYEDRDLIVIDKPAGLVVHPAAGHESGTLVNALIAHCGDTLSGIGGVKRPGIVHRLDKDTSGLLVAAKTDAAHQSLSAQFQSHGADGRLVRRYRAFVWGTPDRPIGYVDAPLARSQHNRTKISVVRGDAGRHAVTHYEVAARYLLDKAGLPLVTELELSLETGRTHQIRVHLTHIGNPILGDTVYGASHLTRVSKLPEAARAALAALGRQALHASTLGFQHPRTGKVHLFHSKLPTDLAALQRCLAGDAPLPGSRARPASMA